MQGIRDTCFSMQVGISFRKPYRITKGSLLDREGFTMFSLVIQKGSASYLDGKNRCILEMSPI